MVGRLWISSSGSDTVAETAFHRLVSVSSFQVGRHNCYGRKADRRSSRFLQPHPAEVCIPD